MEEDLNIKFGTNLIKSIENIVSKYRFFKSWKFIIGIIFVLFFTITSFLGNYFIPYNGITLHLNQEFLPPSLSHPFGTDYLGRDVFARTLEGGSTSIEVGVLAGIVTLLMGGIIGIFSGYYGKYFDLALQRIVDITLSIPTVVFALVLITIAGYSLLTIVLVISLLSWPTLARVTRAETLSLKEQDFVLAELAAGASNLHIIFRHLVPNETRTFVIYSGLSISQAILVQAALAYLGFYGGGISWGFDLYMGQQYIGSGAWWMLFFPGLAITLTCLGFYLVSEALRETLER